MVDWMALDPIHPVYNFLIEYYGLKRRKGTRRLGRWSPDPGLLLVKSSSSSSSSSSRDMDILHTNDSMRANVMIASRGLGGIILEHATMDDVGDGTLHLRGSVPVFVKYDRNGMGEGDVYGLLYHPGVFYGRRGTTNESRDDDDDGEVGKDGNGSDDGERRESLLRTIAPFQWYASILRTTLDSVPVLHCQW